MKQVPKTQQVIDRMRAAFGADVAVDRLPVYEAVILNTQPLRKSSGLFKGARVTPATLSQIANSINQESAPIRLEHNDGQDLPLGRAFYAEVIGADELRALYTIDDAATAAKIDNGTLDQTSVGFMPAAINCSACGVNFLGADASFENIWTLTCSEGHVLNQDGAFAYVDGLAAFHELSMVGKGAARGAKIVGPSESRLANANDNYRRLAAKAGFSGVALTCEALPSTKKDSDVDLAAIVAQLTASTEAKTQAEVKLATAEANLTAANAKVADLEAKLAEANTADAAALTAAQAEAAEAKQVLTDELKAVLTALQQPLENLPTDFAGLKAKLAEKRAEFAAVIPVNGRTTSQAAPATPAAAPSAAFRTR